MTHIRELNEEETAAAIAEELAAVQPGTNDDPAVVARETSLLERNIRNLSDAPKEEAVKQEDRKVRHFNAAPKPAPPANARDHIDMMIRGFEQRIALLQSLKKTL